MGVKNPNDRYNVILAATDGSYRHRIGALPEDMSPGARQVALLTSVTKAQASTIVPMAEALAELKQLGPDIWPCNFLVADKAEFNWRKATWRRYESFDDFYDRELRPIYGDYDSFIHDDAEVLRGRISEDVAATRARDRTIWEVDRADEIQAKKSRQGARNDLGNNVPKVGRPEGNSQAKALRRLRKDRPDLHQRVINEELSPHAAMREAGFRLHTFTVRATTPEVIAGTLRRQLDPDVLQQIAKLLAAIQTEPS